MSTPTPDENEAAARTGSGGDPEATASTASTTAVSEEDPAASPAGSSTSSTTAPEGARDGEGAGGPGHPGRSAGGPPPPWQRGGSRPPTGPVPTPQNRPGGGPAPTPAGGNPRPGPGGPPSGPVPTGRPAGGAAGPAGPGANGPGGNGPGGNGPGAGGPGAGGPAQRRGSTALIDAPTNQLSPEQLGARTGGRPEPEPDFDEPDDDVPSARPSRGKVPRRASLQLKRFDPWSVLKLALVLGVALFFVWMFAVGVLYAVLDGMGVWAQLNGTYQDLTSDTGGGGAQLITAGGVFGVAAVVGVVNTILFTALASVSAFIYNISADVAGGIEVTLSERD